MAYAGTSEASVIVTPLLRDFGAYYQVVIAIDTTQAVAANRTKIYINGTEVATTAGGNGLPSEDYACDFGKAGTVGYIGDRDSTSGTSPFHGYIARTTVIENQRLDPTSFGELTDDGYWQINDASELTFGTNGFLLEGGTNVAAGTDSSYTASSYVPVPVNFDGSNDYLTRGANLTGASDTPSFFISCWVKRIGGIGSAPSYFC